MSDTSPWGVPPSDSGPPPTTPQYSSPQPQYQAPPPQQPSYQPPTPPGGGWQPPPKKRNTAVIVGSVAAALLVIAAFVVTLVVAGGDEKDPATPGEAGPSSATGSTGGSTPATSDSTPTDSTASPATGDLISGDGYTFRLPGVGWQDAIEEARGLDAGGTIDALIILGSSIDLAQSNILVEALSAGSAGSVEDLEGLWKRNLSSSDNATPVDIDDITVAGERAIGVRIADRTNAAGIDIVQVAYLVLHGGNQYSIGLTYPAAGDTVSQSDFEKVLASWEWTS